MLEDSLDTLWPKVVERLQSELSTPSFETWVRSVSPRNMNDDELSLAVPTEFIRQIIATRYVGLLRDIVSKVAGRPIDIRLDIVTKPMSDSSRSKPETVKLREQVGQDPSEDSEYLTRLNPRYVFEAFVVGPSNRFAHAACLAVSEMPSRAYNPLFLYGGVGLGKTHLMHAIGHHVLKESPSARVLYVASEIFTNELINSIRDDKMVSFRQRYRGIDVLLIDDIQFVAGKERTQEEFFHTFEALHSAGKQIVITSDRPPKEIPTLEERLRSRFEWGLIADLQQPDMETRTAILAKKAMIEDLWVPDEVLQLIATQINSNIRELEGALIRVMAYASVTRQQLTPELALEALKDVIPKTVAKPITIRLIQEEVARHYEMRTEEFKAKRRTRAVAYPRQVAMYIAREITNASLPKIGDEFGGRDHTTVMHACEKIDRERHADAQLSSTIDAIISRIRSR